MTRQFCGRLIAVIVVLSLLSYTTAQSLETTAEHPDNLPSVTSLEQVSGQSDELLAASSLVEAVTDASSAGYDSSLASWFSSTSSYNSSNPSADEIINQSIYGLSRHAWAQVVAGVFAFFACVISFAHIRVHLIRNHQTQIRRCVIRMLGLVPLYAMLAFCGLRWPHWSLYFDVARDCYESMVIYSFFQFCLHYLGGAAVLNETLSNRPAIPHSWPINKCCGAHWHMQHRFLFQTRIGVMQYVVLKFALALITFICAASGAYGEGEWAYDTPYTYITIIANVSQGWALYCLLLFYYATKNDLEAIRPMAKFLCIKLIVFATYWQSVALSIAALAERIPTTERYSAATVSAALQDFLICIEMFFAAIGHLIAFPPNEFSRADGSDDSALHDNAFSKIMQVITPGDVLDNLHELNRLQDKYQRVASVEMSNVSKGPYSASDEAELGSTLTLDGIEERIARVKNEVKARARQSSFEALTNSPTSSTNQSIDQSNLSGSDDDEHEHFDLSSDSDSDGEGHDMHNFVMDNDEVKLEIREEKRTRR